MSKKELEEAKQWYMDALESNLILRGKTRKEAKAIIKKSKFKSVLDEFPDISMHYSIEATVDEIIDSH